MATFHGLLGQFMIWKLESKNIRDDRWSLTHITGFVIRATTEREAREIARKNARSSFNDQVPSTNDFWLNFKFTTCEIISENGNSQLILTNFSNP